ncbi:MAG: glycosyltransferase family 39 protein [Anaerolineales bacterium]|nr:glycosyltransferase family 39 protein [Anaerolineales bacterium]
MSSANVRPFLLGLTALALAFAGQWSIESKHYFDAALFFGAASLLFVVAFWPRRYFPERPLAFEWVAAALPRTRWSVVAIALVGVAAALAALSLRTFDEHAPNTVIAWWQHLGSIGLLLAAAAVADIGEARKQRSTPSTESTARQSGVATTKTTLLWLAGILALAAVLRIWRLDMLPFGVWYDEAEHGLQARRILESPEFRPIFEGAITGPAHFLYLVAGSFSLFGVSVQSIRLVSALFGIGAVLAGYIVGREMFGRNAGLILAFLLAVSSWSVTLSRFGMYATATTPFFTLLTLAFLLRAFRRGAWLDFAMTGLAVGLGLCFYTSFRLFVPVVAIFWLLVLVRLWWSTRRPPGSRFWLGAVLAAMMALLVVAPLALFAYRHPEVFWSRVEATYIFSDKGVADQLTALAENAWKHLLMFNAVGDPNGRHNLPGAPMLDTLSAALMVIGLVYSLRRIKEPRYALLVLWPLATLLGGILSLGFEAPQSLRANGSLAAVYVLAVVPLAVLARAWRVSGGRYYPRAWVAPSLILLAIIGGTNILRYFDRQANDFSVWNNYSTPETLTAQKLQTLPPDTDAYVTVFFDGHPTLNFLVPPARAVQAARNDRTPATRLCTGPQRAADHGGGSTRAL